MVSSDGHWSLGLAWHLAQSNSSLVTTSEVGLLITSILQRKALLLRALGALPSSTQLEREVQIQACLRFSKLWTSNHYAY